MQVLILIPTYNEKDNIEKITAAVLEHLPSANILVIDDNSPDGTGDIADRLAQGNEKIKVLHRSGKLGLGTAYTEGFKKALAEEYDVAITFDADFSHPADALPQVVKLLEDYDFVVASRYIKGGRPVGWPLRRYLLSRGANYYAAFMGRMGIKDCTGGFNAIRRKVLESYPLDNMKSRGYVFHHEIKYRAHRAGFRLTEFPIEFTDRREGQSKMSWRIVLEAFFRVLKLRFQKI